MERIFLGLIVCTFAEGMINEPVFRLKCIVFVFIHGSCMRVVIRMDTRVMAPFLVLSIHFGCIGFDL